jgi:hypothetical protein
MVVDDGAATGGPCKRPVNGRAKGATFERKLAAYFEELGYTGARRMIRTGTSKHGDEGDLDGLPFTVQAKTQAKPVTDAQITQWRAETFVQQLRRDHEIGLLVVKRNGYADVRRSWVHLVTSELAWLAGAQWTDFELLLASRSILARVELQQLAPALLRKYPPEQEKK